MLGFVFQEAEWLWLLAVVPVLAVFFVWGARRRRDAVGVYSAGGAVGARRFLWRKNIQAVAICLGFGLLVLALARPGWNPMKEKVSRESRDVIFVLDVSRSMLAQDLKPNRLAHAKATIAACASRLDENQRLGLVAFAGSSAIQCPLARDRRFFLSALENVGPEVVAQGGTRIGDALRKVSDKLLTPAMFGFQDVVLVTDGGDQESDPAGGAEELNELGASLMIVGLGSEGSGARIPNPAAGGREAGGYLIHEGQEVWSKLETAGLEETLAAIDPGRGLLHKGSAAEGAEKYLKFTDHLAKRQVEVELAERYEEGFPWFVGAAFFILLAGMSVRVPPKSASRFAVVALLAFFVLAMPGGFAGADEAGEGDGEGETGEESVENPEAPAEAFNFGNSLLQIGDFSGALARYESGMISPDCGEELRRKILFNMGHCSFRIAEDQESMAGAMPSPEDAAGADEDGSDVYGTVLLAAEYYDRSADYFRAALKMDPGSEGAARNMELARFRADRLRQGLEATDPSGDPEGEEGEDSEGEEMEAEEGDEGQEGDSEESDPNEDFEEGESEDGDPTDLGRSQTSLTDLSNQALPPPSLTPEDLLNEELLNNEARDKSSGRKGKPVERDW